MGGKRVRAVIFDVDGVIADAEPFHFAALRDTLAEEGIPLTEKEYDETYVVLDDRDAFKTAYASAGKPLEEATLSSLLARKAERFDAQLQKGIPLFPGVSEAIRSLSREMPLAIASGALSKEVRHILASHGLEGFFVGVVCADHVTHGKPHPETYLRAYALLKRALPDLKPEECLVVEDTVGGVRGAKAAGMSVLAVTNTTSAERLREADAVVDSLEGVGPSSLLALLEGEARGDSV